MRALPLVLAALLFACAKNPSAGSDANVGPSPSTRTDPSTAPQRPAPAPPSDPTGGRPAATHSDPMPKPEAEPSGGGRLAKPGWCDKDADCTNQGQVCEKCGGAEGQCVPGCHYDSQCAANEYCNQVQCIRCPCPGLCEPKS